MIEHSGLPVHGYKSQSERNVGIVNANKIHEEEMLRVIDGLAKLDGVDQRWLAIGRTNLEQAFMAINRAVFRPGRVSLPSDVNNGD